MTAPVPHRDSRVPIEVAAGVIFRGGKLLITQRHTEAHLGGLWEFPGGKRELHETFEECLMRELREELAIEVEVGSLFHEVTHDYGDKLVYLRFLICWWRRHEPQALGCAAFRWVGPAELSEFPFPAADRELLIRLQAEPELWA